MATPSLLLVKQGQSLGGGGTISDNDRNLHNLFSLTPSPMKFSHWFYSLSSRRENGVVGVRCSIGTPIEPATKSKVATVITGTLEIMPKAILNFNNPISTIKDSVSDLIGKGISLQLVSTLIDPVTGDGKRSPKAKLTLIKRTGIIINDEVGTRFSVSISVDNDFGIPGAFLIENQHPDEFMLKSLNLQVDKTNGINFNCNSWVYNTTNYPTPRIFFYNQPCFVANTPKGLLKLRALELEQLRGGGGGLRKESDRIYDYDVYNDLGNPDRGPTYKRQVLGGSKDFPYPRRCRTGRAKTNSDPLSETPVSLLGDTYIPRDERFGHIKRSDFLGTSVSSVAHLLVPILEDALGGGDNFKNFDDVDHLYTKGMDLHNSMNNPSVGEKMTSDVMNKYKPPLEMIQELKTSDDKPSFLKFPRPQVYQVDNNAWMKDEEFARQTLAGLNPMAIQQLKVFPPQSNLDPTIYGDLTSTLTPTHIEGNMGGLTTQQAMEMKKLFIVDNHDVYLPYLTKINALENRLSYASRSLFFLTNEGVLKPLAIELTLPSKSEQGGRKYAKRVFTPPPPPPPGQQQQQDWLWMLAKAHASVNDVGHHQLISHWLRTHAALEPFIIAAHRQLSALHPLYMLLLPHFKNTMNINAMARNSLIDVDGIIERSFTTGRYSMEISSTVYRSWHFDQEGLPQDLLKRGIAESDPAMLGRVKLLIEDFPYAVDGLEIWDAIKSWVTNYISIYYKDNSDVQNDKELQNWWWEIINVGHGDKKDAEWWVKMETIDELCESLVTLIWIASAHHAAVNFGQYAYAGYMPNKPSMGRRPIPELGSPEYVEMQKDPEKFFLEAVSTKFATVLVMATIEILSTHATDEEYLGSRNTPNWIANIQAIESLKKFKDELSQIEILISARNNNPNLKNRVGPVKVPYTLLVDSSAPGLSGMGIPNSISI